MTVPFSFSSSSPFYALGTIDNQSPPHTMSLESITVHHDLGQTKSFTGMEIG